MMDTGRDSVEIGGTGGAGGGAGGPQGPGGPGGEAGQGGPGGQAGQGGRTFLRLWFTCAGGYARANKLADGTAYVGRCPGCGAAVRFEVGPGGSNRRSFTVSCKGDAEVVLG